MTPFLYFVESRLKLLIFRHSISLSDIGFSAEPDFFIHSRMVGGFHFLEDLSYFHCKVICIAISLVKSQFSFFCFCFAISLPIFLPLLPVFHFVDIRESRHKMPEIGKTILQNQ